ncbi:MAG TPA: AAA family ATPase [Acidimicrobiales bacterium]|nr:AAA family ATPase [Acidimicrobiales bacterium]
MLRLGLLGPPVVEQDGVPATFDTRKSVALLALLAGTAGPRTREGLAVALWPESDDTHARASLRRTLSVTAGAVGPALDVTRTTVALDSSQVWCDLWEFERLGNTGDPLSLAEAASLYRGDFLAGFRARAGAEFDHWHERMADEQRRRLGAALSRLVDAHASTGALDTALLHATRWLSLDELHEPAHQALMRLLAWTDQRAAALAQYRSCVRVLEEELGVEPLTPTTELYELIRADRLGPPPSGGARAMPSFPPVIGHGDRRSGGGREKPAPFVGQDSILTALVADLEQCGESGRVAVVAGPAGSGKTRIMDAFRETVGAGGSWIHARCLPGEQLLELGCVASLLRAALACDPDLVRQLGSRDSAEVARLVPEMDRASEAAVAPLETPGAQLRFFEAVASALGVAARRSRPGVIVIEDAQHIDETSARLLAYVLRRLDALPVLVVVTWQTEAGAPLTLRTVLDELTSSDRCATYAPKPFGLDEITRVLEAKGLSAAVALELLERTEGLPLLVVAYAKTLAEGAENGGDIGAMPPDVPSAVRRLLQQRLATASETTAQLIAAAAVLGSGYDAETLRVTSGRSALEVADALDEALSRGLLVERMSAGDGSPTYEFPHDTLRLVAYDSCGTSRRRLLHGRAADVLARRAGEIGGSARFAAVSAHLERSGRQEAAAQWSWRAAQRSLSLYARVEALEHLRRALELGHPATESRLAIADVLIALGRYREALMQLEHAAAEGAPSDPAVARIEHRLAAVHDRIGDGALAAAHLHAALLAADDPVLRARIVADRAFVAYRSRDPHAASWASRALDEAQATGDPSALAQAHNVTGVLAMLVGRPEAAERSFRSSLEAAQALDDPAPTVAALNNLARLLAEVGRQDEAFAVAREALRRGEEHGDVHRLAALHSNLADLLHAAGRSEESIAHLKDAASAFAGVDAGDVAVPGVWTLTEW